jgi:hypothetical protein
MQNKLNRLLLSLPFLVSVGAALAAPTQPSADAAGVVAVAPADDHAAMPAGCNGCAGKDCANCPLMRAAVEQSATQPATPAAEIRCGTN